VHRDLKPANLFLTRSPDGSALVKVLDFGISKALESGESDQSLTATAAIMGSPLYMSPEQLRSSKNVDARTDVWALGTILFELVSGRTPFEADSVMGLCTTIAADPPTPLRRYRAEVSKDFESVVMSCLEKDPLRRPQNVGELAVALRPFASAEARLAVDRIGRIGPPPRSSLRGSDASGPSIPGGGVASTTGFAETVATWQTASGVKRRRRTTVVIGAVLVVGLLVGGAAWLRVSRNVPVSSATPSSPSTVAATSPPPPSSAPAAPPSSLPVAAVTSAAPSSATTAPDVPASASGGRPLPPWLRSPPAHTTAKPAATPAPPAAATAKPADDLLLDRK
jgi:serine/threonine-protein kinase